MNRRHLFRSGARLAAALLAASAGRAAQAAVPAAEPPLADALAALRVRPMADLQGATRRLAEWQGRVMVLNFWATWCAPCVKEMPELDALQKQFPQAQFIGIGVDTVDNIRKFLVKVPVSYPLLVMGAGAVDTLRGLGDTAGGLPFTLILAADGGINRSILGKIQPDDVHDTLTNLGG
ncbi:MAG TPA: TlpA disulfide reductase family protein [Bordetella sp.]